MPYISRDETGAITAIHSAEEGGEYVSAYNQELLAFIEGGSGEQALKLALQDSDADIARITEDLVYLLVRKNLILFTDLPDAVQSKLLAREKIRSQLRQVGPSLLSEDETL